MRIIFAGTPEFARVALSAILQAGHEVPLVLTQPDRPAGRGMKLNASPVKVAALQVGSTVIQPRSLRLDGKFPDDARAAQEAIAQSGADLMVVAAYGLILPRWTLQALPHGCLNIHASLLPRWRGAAPIQRAIEAGDTATGITIMQMDEGLDTGDMLLWRDIPITDTHTAARLHDELAELGGKSILAALEQVDSGTLAPVVQPQEGVTYAAKLDRAESPLDFNQDAVTLARRIRAFDPVPGTTAPLPGLTEPAKIWAARARMDESARRQAAAAAPGTVLAAGPEGIDLACANGILQVTELQRPGARRQPVDVFVRSWQR